MNSSFPYSKKDLKKLDPDFKIGAIVADGMWYSLTKWRKLAKVSEEEINSWVERHLENGYLIQSPTGAKSFRIPYHTVIDWHEEHGLEPGDQIFDFIFPTRLWDGMTEVEGFMKAPLREIGAVTFECTGSVAVEIIEQLRGIARVREIEPNKFKAYCLSVDYVKPIIQDVFSQHTVAEVSRIYSRSSSYRRELVDFSPNFVHHLTSFYRNFAKTLVRKEMDTIRIYIPEPQDQESQIISWVFTAIEKFDESASVPFSGYLNSVLNRWPYDLPNLHLGQDLSIYQRNRAKAIERLRQKSDIVRSHFSSVELSQEMGMKPSDFRNFEEKHNMWMKTKTATNLTWHENSEEKQGTNVIGGFGDNQGVSNLEESNRLSVAIVEAALNSECYDDAFTVISQMDTDEIDINAIRDSDPAFVMQLGSIMGIKG